MVRIRQARMVMVTLAVAGIAYILWQARGALAPFLVGALLAFVLSPMVERLVRYHPWRVRRPGLVRTLAVLEVYIAGLAVVITAGAIIIPGIINEGAELIDHAPSYVRQARSQLKEWNEIYERRVPLEVRNRIEIQTERIGAELGNVARNALNKTFGILTSTFSIVLGYIVVPFWLFYILKDRHQLGPTIENWFPPAVRPDVDHCIEIWRRVIGSYIRAQLTLGLFIGTITTVGLWLMGVEYYYILGLVAGITEMIPVIGPILGSIPAFIVVLATEPEKVWWILLFYLAVQQVENAVLVPRIQGEAVNLHPAVIIVLLVVAQQLAGFFGMLIVVPLAGVSRDLFVYIYRRLREEEVKRDPARLRTTAVTTVSGQTGVPPLPLPPASTNGRRPAVRARARPPRRRAASERPPARSRSRRPGREEPPATG